MDTKTCLVCGLISSLALVSLFVLIAHEQVSQIDREVTRQLHDVEAITDGKEPQLGASIPEENRRD